MNNVNNYTGADLAILIPTKDRPVKIKNLLDSLILQTEQCRKIIVVDGGVSIEDLVLSYQDKLPVVYYECNPPGQIRQRNFGISKLDCTTILVGTLDDDIVLMPDAIEKMITFWNTVPDNTAGVSFNIVNCTPQNHTRLKGMMGLTGPLPGKVLRSGVNTPILSITRNIESQWICGGATVWRQEILIQHANSPQDAQWASSEDLIFSYPLGKIYPLFVCASAKVNHEHVYDLKIKKKHKYYGRTETLWRFYFVESNEELSRIFFLWSQLTTIIARCIKGTISLNIRHFQFAFGQLQGVIIGLKVVIREKNLKDLLNESSLGNE